LLPQPRDYEIDDVANGGRQAYVIVRENKTEPLLGTEENLDQVDFVHAEVIMQIAAERQVVFCVHKPVFIRNCDDLLDR